MERRGVIPVTMGFNSVIGAPDIERLRYVFTGFSGSVSFSPFEQRQVMEGCVLSDGPFPNSVRYDHHRDIIAALPAGTNRVPFRAGSCLRSKVPDAFVVVQYSEAGEPLWAMNCENLGPNGINNCLANFSWDEIRIALVAVDRAHMHRMPEFIERTRALFRSFREAGQERLAQRRAPWWQFWK
jgi:hypothetical protein